MAISNCLAASSGNYMIAQATEAWERLVAQSEAGA